jgi:hypothetical protein
MSKYSLDSCLTDLVNRYLKIGDLEYLLEKIERTNREMAEYLEEIGITFDPICFDCDTVGKLYARAITDGDSRIISTFSERRSVLPNHMIDSIERYVRNRVAISNPIEDREKFSNGTKTQLGFAFSDMFYDSILRFGSLGMLRYFRDEISDCPIEEKDIDLSISNPNRGFSRYLITEVRTEKLLWIQEYKNRNLAGIEPFETDLSNFDKKYRF